MTDYKKYINALRKCAKEHEDDRTSFGHIIVSDLCRDTANLLESLEQQPCEDTISRQAAIDALIKWYGYEPSDIGAFENIIDKLPSAQPERKGYWIEMGTNKDGTHSIRCSKCGGGYKTRGYAWSIATKTKYKFCPNCGADMRGEQDDD